MKLQLATLSFVVSLVVFVHPAQCQQATDGEHETKPAQPLIQNSRTGETIDVGRLCESFSQSDVVFLGEQHDNDSGHEFQLKVIQELVGRGHAIAISTEQFERDVQGALDDYLSGRLDEDKFLEVSRPWKNYREHYRPIIEFAREHKIPVIAGNIPRRVAASVSRGKSPAAEDRALLPRQTTASKNAYWQKFKATMEGHMGTDDGNKLELFFASQCLKDDAMAEAITDFMATNSHQPKIVVHLCGHFHSDYGLGTVARVMQRRPLTRFSVVTMESVDNWKDTATLANLSARSHFTFWTVGNRKPEVAAENGTR